MAQEGGDEIRLKCAYNGEILVMYIEPGIRLERFLAAMREVCGFSEQQRFTIKWVDEEGDPCTIESQEELDEAIRLYEINKDSEINIHDQMADRKCHHFHIPVLPQTDKQLLVDPRESMYSILVETYCSPSRALNTKVAYVGDSCSLSFETWPKIPPLTNRCGGYPHAFSKELRETFPLIGRRSRTRAYPTYKSMAVQTTMIISGEGGDVATGARCSASRRAMKTRSSRWHHFRTHSNPFIMTASDGQLSISLRLVPEPWEAALFPSIPSYPGLPCPGEDKSIYRRGARRWRKIYLVNGHMFQAKRFNRKAFCTYCMDRIWGLGRQVARSASSVYYSSTLCVVISGRS
ncbi:protein kinase C iota type isoform 1 [Tropilaelaps mercedesae]|uniref:Protein kinase C iota type isoform 1 n=1 Tax=Tropilaelaps mercedesae TaxID=418985 RepID=A0A1V9Y176_9ACAR|nr:protein kinase C iota type isoform 1 [Tropilaelaps mercedesae]